MQLSKSADDVGRGIKLDVPIKHQRLGKVLYLGLYPWHGCWYQLGRLEHLRHFKHHASGGCG